MLKRIGLSKSGYYRHKSKGLSKSKERQLTKNQGSYHGNMERKSAPLWCTQNYS